MLEKRIEAIRKAKHGYPPAELECVFAEARAALSRSKPLQPCLSHFVTLNIGRSLASTVLAVTSLMQLQHRLALSSGSRRQRAFVGPGGCFFSG